MRLFQHRQQKRINVAEVKFGFYAKGKTYSIEVTLGMFNMMETFFEPPVADELSEARVVHT
ncbi:hypothetical protein [Vibrio sp. F74]|uniref:hypothetical protein n=1 Tax=Vibrio sp. F74 TaxID=700020 RepID=UPI0035F539F7